MAKPEATALELGVARGVLREADLARCRAELGETADEPRMLEWLVEHGLLTKWQTVQLKSGRARNLVLDHYKLLAPIGAGGMGTVFRALDCHLGRDVAIKILPPSAATPGAVGRFRREALAALQLRHGHVVASFELGQQGSIHFLVMELVDGPSLSAHLGKKKRLSVQESARIGYEVALALEHARQQGIVHRDIKPSNILLSRQGVVKVADLGLAKFFGPQSVTGGAETRTGQFMGTIDYCSPEQAQDAKRADIRSDIYSLGCTLYHCLTGRPPFAGGTEVERIMAHIELLPAEIRTKNPEVPPAFAELIEKRLLAKQPDERFQTPAEAAEALAPWAAGQQGTNVNLWAALSGLEDLLEEAALPTLPKAAPRNDTMPQGRNRAVTRQSDRGRPHPKGATLFARPVVCAAIVVAVVGGITAVALVWRGTKREPAIAVAGVGSVDKGGVEERSSLPNADNAATENDADGGDGADAAPRPGELIQKRPRVVARSQDESMPNLSDAALVATGEPDRLQPAPSKGGSGRNAEGNKSNGPSAPPTPLAGSAAAENVPLVAGKSDAAQRSEAQEDRPAQKFAAPRLLEPADGKSFNHVPRKTRLRWSAVELAVKYKVEIQFTLPGKKWGTLPNSTSIEEVEKTELEFEFFGAQPGRWRVWAVAGTGAEGAKSEWRTFIYRH